MILLAQSNGQISRRLAADLADVESRFAAELHSDLSCVNELAGHIERYRGKMLRPTLVLVSAMAVDLDADGVREAHRVLATVTEMVHMATLVHDDILDEAEMRRRGATVNHLNGNETAVMLGDYLISHAYHLCSSLSDSQISRMVAAATNTVCEGELLQLANRRNHQLDEPTYFEIIRRKTASLCGACCRIAATISRADESQAAALDAYGQKLGIAFQIVDDVLDLVGDEGTVGKTLGLDLEKTKLTLPVIHYLREETPEHRAALARLLDRLADASVGPDRRAELTSQVRGLLRGSASLDYARGWAGRLVDEAKTQVAEHLPESPARALLIEMADAVVSRRY